jgi:gliding motility-associated-like protein
MRTALFLLLFSSLIFFTARGQVIARPKIPAALPAYYQDILTRSSKPRSVFEKENRKPFGTLIPTTITKNRDSLSAYIKKLVAPSKKVNGASIISRQSSLLAVDPACKDTSFEKLIGLTNFSMYMNSIYHTKDDGVMMIGGLYDLTVPGGSSHYSGFILKTDNDGNVLWVKIFNETSNAILSSIYLQTVTETGNGDIVVAGQMDTTFTINNGCLFLARLNAQGNLLWYKTYASALSIVPGQLVTIDTRSITEGPNNDLILCGTTNTYYRSQHFETIIRTDASGNRIWDVNYDNLTYYQQGVEGVYASVINGNVVALGISHADNYNTSSAIGFLTLDYNNGNILYKRFYNTDYSDQGTLLMKSFSYYYNKVTRLKNGNYLFYGPLLSDFDQVTDPIDHFGVLEFDQSQNLLQSYSISSHIPSNYYGDQISFDEKGNGAFMLFQYSGNTSENIFIGALNNNRFLKERVVFYNNISLGANSSYGNNNKFCFFNDGGYVLGQNYYKNFTTDDSYLEFRKMHNSDTSSACLGADTVFAFKLPLNMKEIPPTYVLDSPFLNQLSATAYSSGPGLDPATTIENPCEQHNYCDTLKIHGPAIFCTNAVAQTFTAFRNASCGAIVQWDVDTSMVLSQTVINDSTISILFKNNNWQGQIHAQLPAGTCTPVIMDSMQIKIISAPKPVNLGPDTVICVSNTILLHAGPAFATYLWQDGSTDSLFSVTQPGTYFVEVYDYCGNTYYDTVLVNAAQYFFTAGNDTIKCNGDSILLKPTAGFSNYQWLPANYNIQANSLTGAALVYPSADTSYIVTAEKRAGCFVKDTVQIKVFHSPIIQLGNDTSFCVGQSEILDAGAGFTTYNWSTGENARTIVISQPGQYKIKATTVNGCSSHDSLILLHIYPLPVFYLSNTPDTTICDNKSLSYSFSLAGATYLWNNGNNSSNESFNLPGQYWLAITQNGCTSKDTVNLLTKPSPVISLGTDTSLCEGVTKLLDATTGNASYLWQDGSKASTFKVENAGIYSVSVDLNECFTSDTIRISYLPKPVVKFSSDSFICKGNELRLEPAVNGPVNYLWQDGSTDNFFIAKEPGLYSVTANNICGSGFGSVQIVTGTCNLQLPGAFSPNKDGINDVFRIKYPFPVKQFKMQVFSRWGQLLFETSDISKGWDGTLHGANEPEGGYPWFITLTDADNKTQTARGTVILIR